jgi:glycosyltransferase involved in cell wall biosynthesis
MKIFINRKPVNGPWGGGNMFIKNFFSLCHENNLEIVDSPEKLFDVYFMVGFDQNDVCDAIYHKTRNPRMKLIARINENDSRKATDIVDKRLIELSVHLDGTIFVSNWLQEYFGDLWHDKNKTVIINGVDKEIFHSSDKKLSNQNNKINVVTHHWSDNYLKGFDIYEKLDEFVASDPRFSFTYIGRDRKTFKNTIVISPLFGQQLGDKLSQYDVYISASRYDPGPNSVIESVSCNLPTYVHQYGGGSVEFAGSDHVYHDWEELKKILIDRQFKSNITEFPTWDKCIEQCDKFMKGQRV